MGRRTDDGRWSGLGPLSVACRGSPPGQGASAGGGGEQILEFPVQTSVC